jgi:hypothetical protein
MMGWRVVEVVCRQTGCLEDSSHAWGIKLSLIGARLLLTQPSIKSLTETIDIDA